MVDVTSCGNGGISKTFPRCTSTVYRPSLNTTSKWPAANCESNKLFHKGTFDWLYSRIKLYADISFEREILDHSNVTFILIAYSHPNSWFYHASEAKQGFFRVYSIFSDSGILSIELRVGFEHLVHLFPFRLTKGKQIPIVEYMTLFTRSQRHRDKFVSYKKFITNKLYNFVSSHDNTISS